MVYHWVGLLTLAMAMAAVIQLAPPSESAGISDLPVELNENIIRHLEVPNLTEMGKTNRLYKHLADTKLPEEVKSQKWHDVYLKDPVVTDTSKDQYRVLKHTDPSAANAIVLQYFKGRDDHFCRHYGLQTSLQGNHAPLADGQVAHLMHLAQRDMLRFAYMYTSVVHKYKLPPLYAQYDYDSMLPDLIIPGLNVQEAKLHQLVHKYAASYESKARIKRFYGLKDTVDTGYAKHLPDLVERYLDLIHGRDMAQYLADHISFTEFDLWNAYFGRGATNYARSTKYFGYFDEHTRHSLSKKSVQHYLLDVMAFHTLPSVFAQHLGMGDHDAATEFIDRMQNNPYLAAFWARIPETDFDYDTLAVYMALYSKSSGVKEFAQHMSKKRRFKAGHAYYCQLSDDHGRVQGNLFEILGAAPQDEPSTDACKRFKYQVDRSISMKYNTIFFN